MGYPMTWRRVLARNGLTDGDYGKPPRDRAILANVDDDGWVDPENFRQVEPGERLQASVRLCREISTSRAEELKRQGAMWCALAGDIRRLEHDATDERSTCKHIAEATGIDLEVVAAVLKEFMDW